jgi:hypothetical protein
MPLFSLSKRPPNEAPTWRAASIVTINKFEPASVDESNAQRVVKLKTQRGTRTSESVAHEGVHLDDCFAHMPMHTYIFAPSREMWPASSVNSRIGKVPLFNADGTPTSFLTAT